MYYPLGTDKGVDDLVAPLRPGWALLGSADCLAARGKQIAKGEVAPRGNVQLVIDELEELLKKDAAHSDFMPPPEKLEQLPASRRAAVLVNRLAEAIQRTDPAGAPSPVPRLSRQRGAAQGARAARCVGHAAGRGLLRGRHPDAHRDAAHAGRAPRARLEAARPDRGRAGGHRPRRGRARLKSDGQPDLKAFEASIAKRPDQFFTNQADLLDWARKTVARAMAALPRDFWTMPQRPMEVKAVEAWRAASAGAAFYQQAPDDGLTPAYYYVNTDKPETRTLYDQECTVFHEGCWPPSSDQHRSIPSMDRYLRRNGGSTAYVEGWALYTERLADELALYSSPVARYGMLSGSGATGGAPGRGHRPARHALDAQGGADVLHGAHHRSARGRGERDRSLHHLASARPSVTWWASREILKLRAEAKARLGVKFDIRGFHDAILGAWGTCRCRCWRSRCGRG